MLCLGLDARVWGLDLDFALDCDEAADDADDSFVDLQKHLLLLLLPILQQRQRSEQVLELQQYWLHRPLCDFLPQGLHFRLKSLTHLEDILH